MNPAVLKGTNDVTGSTVPIDDDFASIINVKAADYFFHEYNNKNDLSACIRPQSETPLTDAMDFFSYYPSPGSGRISIINRRSGSSISFTCFESSVADLLEEIHINNLPQMERTELLSRITYASTILTWEYFDENRQLILQTERKSFDFPEPFGLHLQSTAYRQPF